MAYASRSPQATRPMIAAHHRHDDPSEQRVSWGDHLPSPTRNHQHAAMTDSGGFDTASFSNYEYSDSYDGEDDDFQAPVRDSPDYQDSVREQYSAQHGGYGYRPHYVGPRDSYESYLSRGSSGPYYRESTDRSSYRDSHNYQRQARGYHRDSRDYGGDGGHERSSAGYSRYRGRGSADSASYYRGSRDYGGGHHRSSADYSSYIESADYSSYFESADQNSSAYSESAAQSVARGARPARRRVVGVQHPARQSAATATRSSMQSTGGESYYAPLRGPFRHAWERTRDELCNAAREELEKQKDGGGGFETVPEWVRRAMERKEAADKLERSKLRMSDARFAAMLEGTERELAKEQRRLHAIADERAELEAQRRRLELHRRAKDLVPESTYDPHPPPQTFPWTEGNRDQMHKLCLARYEAEQKQKRREAQAAEAERKEAEAVLEQAAYSYDAPYYWLDKGPCTRPLSSPSWSDVAVLKRRNKNPGQARRAGRQGQTIVLR
mmetsp:Transcript_37914/g.107127  ORF Transcript_37914/g.107127 Transcript_37914/m.107127 type:complete len:497 (+) Transcript_37914:217-1707(+)